MYLLGAYVLLQFFWWARLLVVQGAQLREARGEPARELMELPNTWMVIGEGTVFFVLLVSGWWMIERATRRELQAAPQPLRQLSGRVSLPAARCSGARGRAAPCHSGEGP